MEDVSIKYIRKVVQVPEILAGLAEEATELAHAALKLRRVYDGANPTPVSEETAIDNLYEEIADVKLYLQLLYLNDSSINEIAEQKKRRWVYRLRRNERGEEA